MKYFYLLSLDDMNLICLSFICILDKIKSCYIYLYPDIFFLLLSGSNTEDRSTEIKRHKYLTIVQILTVYWIVFFYRLFFI